MIRAAAGATRLVVGGWCDFFAAWYESELLGAALKIGHLMSIAAEKTLSRCWAVAREPVDGFGQRAAAGQISRFNIIDVELEIRVRTT